MSVKQFAGVVAIAVVTGMGASVALGQITIPTVTIGNPGNPADTRVMNDGTTDYGSVSYTYNIGRTEVTNAQYTAFLNAKAAADTKDLYSVGMAGPFGSISRSGSFGSYTYSTVAGRENHPVNYVSFWDATRFANWLHNGQGNGDTETGAYTLTPGGISANTITRNTGWQWALTSENEWYKAAYHQAASEGGDADNYWLYPTSGNTIDRGQANYIGTVVGDTIPVASYRENYYGTFDMGGNVREWNEAILDSHRGHRGGSFIDVEGDLRADFRSDNFPPNEARHIGFRVVQIPGPTSIALLAIGGLAAARRRR